MISPQQIAEIVNKISTHFQPEKVVLFGSHAWGQPEDQSDIDLLIVKNTDDTRSYSREIDRSLFPRSFAIDVVVYTPEQVEKRLAMGDQFITRIFRDGKVLYGN